MYAGISSEVLFSTTSSFSIGTELNYVKARDYRQLFKLKEVSGLAKTNGHISGYWDTGYYDYLAQLDFGII